MSAKISPLLARIRRQALLLIFCGGVSVAHAQTPVAPQSGSPEPANAAGVFGDSKRVALLIGQSDYRGAPLPSATADVAMMASQLTAAGFDVDSAGDLPEQGIAERVRALVDRLTLKGDDAVAFVYISGRFAQINGENVLLPVGVPIDRAIDATLNGFSMRKLISTLESVPAKTRLVVLDAGPAPPSLGKEATFSPGLAIMQPPEGFLISFSQGPNRHLVDSVSQPGTFSKALFESILQPTGDIADVFKNVRLRVHTETNGLQVPWESSKLKGQEFAFHPLSGAVANAPPLLTSIGSVAEVKALTRDDAYKQVVATDSITSYQAFMEAYPQDEAVPAMQYTLAVRREAEVWDRATRANSSEAYWTYISAYPDGGNAIVARDRLALLGHGVAPPRGFAPVAFTDLPPPLPGREIIASSASMPLELAPRAPRINIPPAPAIIAATAAAAVAAVALPAIMNRGGGRQIPPVAQATVRPTWAPPAPASAVRPAPTSLQGAPARAPAAVIPSAPIAATAAQIPAPGQTPNAARPLSAPPPPQTATTSPSAAVGPAVRPLGTPPALSPVSSASQTTGPSPQPGAASAPAVRPLAAPGAPNQQIANPSAQPGAIVRPLTGVVSGPGPANPGAQPGSGVRPLAPMGAAPQAAGAAPGITQPLATPNFGAAPMRPITNPTPTAAAPMQRMQPAQGQPIMNQRAATPQVARPMAAPQVYRAPVQQPVRAPVRSCSPQQAAARQC